MNVERNTAFDLLRAFSRIEFALKNIPEFVNGAVGNTPEPQWGSFYVHVRRKIEDGLGQDSKNLLLGTHTNDPPPKKMRISAQGRVEFVHEPLAGPEGDRLIDAARRVRNNLVHGGKEHHEQLRYHGHDEKLARAAVEVMYLAMASHPDVARLAFYD